MLVVCTINLSTDEKMTIYIEDWEYSEDSAAEEWAEHCTD